MNSKADAALAKLDAIEAETRRIGYWEADPPDLRAAVRAGRIKSFLDAPSFELWLQCIFLPAARGAARENRLPDRSQVGLMAMHKYEYQSHVTQAQDLLWLLSEFDAIVEGGERALASGTQAMSDDPRLPKASDFPPGTAFVIKEFDTPLAQVPGQGWICWWGGAPRPYDPRSLKVDNNWLADSFEEWVGIVAESLWAKTVEDEAKAHPVYERICAQLEPQEPKSASKVIVKIDPAKADAEYERLRGQLDPQDPQFGSKVCELFQAAGLCGSGSLGKKLDLLTYLVENELAPAMPGFIKFHPEPVEIFDLVSVYMDDPQALGFLTSVCKYEVAKYADDQMAAAQAGAFRRPIEAKLEASRQDPAEAERSWQAGREWWPQAHAEREKAHLLFRLVESKAKLQRP